MPSRSSSSSDRADPDVADPTTARLVLSIPHTTASNHNGGQLQFGPDGFLYVSTGDGGNTPATAQELGSELGKILRIDARTGAAAPGNPFGSRVWAYGLRNPWRFTFDRGTGDLLIGDVGQSAQEEVNWATAASGRGPGANFGWPCREGDIAGPGPACSGATTGPAFARSSADGFHAIVGGYVVRDPGLPTLVRPLPVRGRRDRLAALGHAAEHRRSRRADADISAVLVR